MAGLAKKLILRFLKLTVSNEAVFMKVKDAVFSDAAELLFRIRAYAYEKYPLHLHLPIIDIGAADGGTVAYFSKHFPKAAIIGFEPITKVYHIARERNLRNKNVTLKNVALFDSVGKKDFHVTSNYLSSSLNEPDQSAMSELPFEFRDKVKLLEKQEVSTSTLDIETKDIPEILLIKMDTQGSELNVLRGGMAALKKTHLVLVEMNNNGLYKNGCQYYEVDAFLREQGFKLADIIVTYKNEGRVSEYDAIYENENLN